MCPLAGGLFYSVLVRYFGDGEGIREGLHIELQGREIECDIHREVLDSGATM